VCKPVELAASLSTCRKRVSRLLTICVCFWLLKVTWLNTVVCMYVCMWLSEWVSEYGASTNQWPATCISVACLQGLRCSRCLYTQHCAGCELPRDSSEIALQPGDHLAVQFFDLPKSQLESSPPFVDHSSMELRRPSEPLSLYDCFHAFTERLASHTVIIVSTVSTYY